MLFVLDNYDSFTYNLVQYFGELGAEPTVYRNDTITPEDVERLKPFAIVISPGPGVPAQAGISIPLIRRFAGSIPILGVCLGHQAIGEAFGGKVVRAERLMHGKTSPVAHAKDPLFEGIPSPFEAMRYHSLVVEAATCPRDLEVTAWTADRPKGTEIMALRHRKLPVWGVQFHPESVGTDLGKGILKNFLQLVAAAV
jgi:anthranilate synthase/aminodeoxychorismate synthase-like glutamine amidotransferase